MSNVPVHRPPSALEVEVGKIILSNSLDYIKTVAQTVQTLTTLLLTAYVALLVGFCKDRGFEHAGLVVVAFLPIAFFVISHLMFIGQALSYKPRQFVLDANGLPVKPVNTFEEVSKARRQQLIGPTAFTVIGLILVLVAFLNVIIPAQVGRKSGGEARTGAHRVGPSSTP